MSEKSRVPMVPSENAICRRYSPSRLTSITSIIVILKTSDVFETTFGTRRVPVLHQRVAPQGGPLFNQAGNPHWQSTIYYFPIGNENTGAKTLVSHVEVWRSVVIKEHPHRNSEEVGNSGHATCLSHLLRLDIRRLDDRPPLSDLGGLQRSQCLGRELVGREQLLAKLTQPLAHGRIGERAPRGGVELQDHVARRAFRRPQAAPVRDVESREARFVDGRDVGRG